MKECSVCKKELRDCDCPDGVGMPVEGKVDRKLREKIAERLISYGVSVATHTALREMGKQSLATAGKEIDRARDSIVLDIIALIKESLPELAKEAGYKSPAEISDAITEQFPRMASEMGYMKLAEELKTAGFVKPPESMEITELAEILYNFMKAGIQDYNSIKANIQSFLLANHYVKLAKWLNHHNKAGGNYYSSEGWVKTFKFNIKLEEWEALEKQAGGK